MFAGMKKKRSALERVLTEEGDDDYSSGLSKRVHQQQPSQPAGSSTRTPLKASNDTSVIEDDEDDNVQRVFEEDEDMAAASQRTLQSLLEDDDDEGDQEALARQDSPEPAFMKKKKKTAPMGKSVFSPQKSPKASQTTEGNGQSQNSKKRRTTLETSMKDYIREQRRRWIEPLEDGGEGYRILVSRNRDTAPVVKDLNDARQVVHWFREEGFVGVKRKEDNDLFQAYFIMNGELVWINNEYETAEDAARAHDDHLRANRLSYIKNFRMARGPARAEARIPNRNADFVYHARESKAQFVRYNVRYTRALVLRLSADPTADGKDIWRALESLCRLCSLWGVGQPVPMRVIRDFSEGLRVAFKLGDRQICKESIDVLLPDTSDLGLVPKGEKKSKPKLKPALRKLLKLRLKWAAGIFEQFQIMYANLVHKRYPRDALSAMIWGSDILRLQACLIAQLESEARLEYFGELLEQLEHHQLWKHHSDFLCLRGEYLLSQRNDIRQMRLAQRLFAKALKADAHNSRAMLLLTSSEHLIHKVQTQQMKDTLVSISQRTTQDVEELDSDEEQEGAGIGDAVVVTKRINEAVRDHPKSLTSWLALEALLFVESSDLDTEEIRENKRICLLRLLDLEPTLTGSAIPRLARLWNLTRDGSVEQKLQFFWVAVSVTESLTQKECPTYIGYVSAQSIAVWEFLVACLESLPEGSIQFDEKRSKLWCRRFYPNTIGYFQDPLSFYLDTDLVKRRKMQGKFTINKCKPYEYLLALKAVVAWRTSVCSEFYEEVVKLFGKFFIHEQAVTKAVTECATMATDALT